MLKFFENQIFMRGLRCLVRPLSRDWWCHSRLFPNCPIKLQACVILKREEVSAWLYEDSHSCDHHQPDRTGHMAAETFRSVSATSSLAAHFCCCSIDQWVAYVLELPDQYDAVRFSMKQKVTVFRFHTSGFNRDVFKWKIYSMSLSSLEVHVWSWISSQSQRKCQSMHCSLSL